MVGKLIILFASAVLGGLWWELGSDFGLAFNLGVRPIALAGIVAILWATDQLRKRLTLLLASVVLSNVVANLIYALQTEPWYVTSDPETQLWIAISVVIQIGVSLVALLAIGRMRRNRIPNEALHATSAPAPGAGASSHEG